MKLNKNLISKFQKSNSKLLAVTKYWNLEETKNLIWQFSLKQLEVFLWFWENRLNSLKQKKLNRKQTHFIWNIQTKQIKDIVYYCETIHSIDNLKHIKKIEENCLKMNLFVKVFLQINIDESKPNWIGEEKIKQFIQLINNCNNIKLIWISAIWKWNFTYQEKVKEFKLLKIFRDNYMPGWLISAWTSKDYEIALEEKIDIIRIWNSLVL